MDSADYLRSIQKRYQRPVLVSSVDGVGTKLKIAFAMNRHDTIGHDLVNHCVNDIAVLGAKPLFFLDYIGTGKLDASVFRQIIEGFARGCVENHCALIGGETAQMPGFYRPKEYDLSGTIIGVVERDEILDGETIGPGDQIIGLASSGLHTNGYSLARKIFFEQMRLKPASWLPELNNTIGDELLKVHRSYGDIVQKLLKTFNSDRMTRSSNRSRSSKRHSTRAIKAWLILLGRFAGQHPACATKNCDVVIRKDSWKMLPIFQILRARGGVPESELYQVFNMGIGMTIIVEAERADEVLRFCRGQKREAWLIGEVKRGRRKVNVV